MYLIIDGSSMLTTNFFGTLPKEVIFAKTRDEQELYFNKIMQTSDGIYTNGVYTSLKQIFKIINEQAPQGIAVAFDAGRHTFREKISPSYKETRTETIVPLRAQFVLFESILSSIGIPVFLSPEYEADDFAGSIAAALEAEGNECVLMSADKDFYQLVTERTKLWRMIPGPARQKYEKVYGLDGLSFDDYTRKHNLPNGVFEITCTTGIIAEKEVVDLAPDQFIDYLAVVGDKCDNISGIPGVGPQTIIPLLQEYGSVNEIYRLISDEETDLKQLALYWKNKLGIKKNPINALIAGRDSFDLSKELATIKTDISIPNSGIFYDLRLDRNAMEEAFRRYEMKSLWNYI